MRGSITLLGAYVQGQLTSSLHDLIQTYLEDHLGPFLPAASRSVHLSAFRFVSSEKADEKYSMRCTALVKVPGQKDVEGTLTIELAVNGEILCLENS